MAAKSIKFLTAVNCSSYAKSQRRASTHDLRSFDNNSLPTGTKTTIFFNKYSAFENTDLILIRAKAQVWIIIFYKHITGNCSQ